MEKSEKEGSQEVLAGQQVLSGQSDWEVKYSKLKSKLEHDLEQTRKKNEMKQELKKLLKDIKVEKSKNGMLARLVRRFRKNDEF